MPLLEKKIYTIEAIYALPEGKRAELIDGKIYYMAPPAESIRIFRGNYMRILKVISVPMVETVRFMRLLLRYIWMKQRIHMLSRTYLLSVILIS